MRIQKYRKNPIDIEAIQMRNLSDIHVLNEFTDNKVILEEGVFKVYDYLHSTWVSFKIGDWILKGIKGEFYPCEELVFAETYSLVEPE